MVNFFLGMPETALRHFLVCTFTMAVLVLPQFGHAQTLKPESLVTKGLNFETELTGIYLGDFENARLDSVGPAVSLIFKGYLGSYARKCSAHLPKNKVEMTEDKCATEEVTRNGWGVEISRHCVSWVKVGTGLYAAPALYASSERLGAKIGLPMISHLFSGPSATQKMEQDVRRMVDDSVALGDDMEALVRNNDCSSPALKRFEENLYRFVEDKPPLLLPNKDTLASVRNISKANFKTDNINLSKLIDDLVIENSRGWMMNRYISGSVTNVQVTNANSDGSPNTVAASYRFQGFGGPGKGTITLHFSDNLPKCLYFFDSPQTCRHPSRRIITSFEKGEYRSQ